MCFFVVHPSKHSPHVGSTPNKSARGPEKGKGKETAEIKLRQRLRAEEGTSADDHFTYIVITLRGDASKARSRVLGENEYWYPRRELCSVVSAVSLRTKSVVVPAKYFCPLESSRKYCILGSSRPIWNTSNKCFRFQHCVKPRENRFAGCSGPCQSNVFGLFALVWLPS